MKPSQIVILFGFNFLIFTEAIAQNVESNFQRNIIIDSSGSKRVIMAAGMQFKASQGKEFWWGKHWREEWITPVSFSFLNLDTTAGGLTPLKMGGGHETKSLRLKGMDGKEYVIRTVDKNLDVLIPKEFKESFIAEIINDQISTAHPYGPLVAANLAESIQILHTNPQVVFVPDNDRLGEFKKEFADKLCLFEERPNGDGWENTRLTGFAGNIDNSEKLFEKLKEDNKKKVDQKAYLKVRLYDMLINDWDRHEDQWLWAEHKSDGKITYYEAFARDRDQALSKTDGVNLYFISRPWALRSIQNLRPNIKDVIGTNLSATSLDKQFTNELTDQDWHDVIESLQKLLTDSAIRKALLQMPPDIYAISGENIYNLLRSRRDNMMDYGMRYYKIINKIVTITGSDEEEFFSIDRLTDQNIEITLQALNKKGNPKDTIFHRIFNGDVTKEINLYGLGGNDKFVYKGNNNSHILVRTIGGDGSDAYIDSVDQKISKTKIYDDPLDKPTSLKYFNYHSTTDSIVTTYNRKWFKYDWWMPLVFPSYNADDGILLGAGFSYKKQKWNKTPFAWQQTLSGTYAVSTGAFSIFYKGLFKHMFGKWDLDLTANYRAPSYVINFYGFGNNTELIVKEKSFYRIRATSLYFNPAASRSWANNVFNAGLFFYSVKVRPTQDKFINLPGNSLDSSVYTTQYFAGANVSYTLNTSNNSRYPTRGIVFNLGSAYTINTTQSNRSFVNLHSAFTFYLTPVKRITIAHRSGFATNIGDYEFYQANTLGGNENLRGYWRTRFTGQTSFYQNSDVRFLFAHLKGNVLRGGLGIYGFFDDGRVWIKDEDSDKFNTDYGGGLFFIPYGVLSFNVYFAASKEVNVFNIRASFMF